MIVAKKAARKGALSVALGEKLPIAAENHIPSIKTTHQLICIKYNPFFVYND